MLIRYLPIYFFFLSAFLFQSQAWAEGDGHNGIAKLLRFTQGQASLMDFSEAKIYLEQNATDSDTEVVILAKGGDIGIRKLWIFSPTK